MSSINNQYAEDRDLVLECITEHYKKSEKRGNHRVQVRVDTFSGVVLVECEYKGILYRDWFLDGAPVYTYWLTRDQRIGIVKTFFEAGYTQSKIALMLGFSPSTIGKDVQFLRCSWQIPREGNPYREKPTLAKNHFKISRLKLVSNGRGKSHHAQLNRVARTMASS
jgi:hypothetical protein